MCSYYFLIFCLKISWIFWTINKDYFSSTKVSPCPLNLFLRFSVLSIALKTAWKTRSLEYFLIL